MLANEADLGAVENDLERKGISSYKGCTADTSPLTNKQLALLKRYYMCRRRSRANWLPSCV
jgi:hypothetical protein